MINHLLQLADAGDQDRKIGGSGFSFAFDEISHCSDLTDDRLDLIHHLGSTAHHIDNVVHHPAEKERQTGNCDRECQPKYLSGVVKKHSGFIIAHIRSKKKEVGSKGDSTTSSFFVFDILTLFD